jgi:hypothetical protein
MHFQHHMFVSPFSESVRPQQCGGSVWVWTSGIKQEDQHEEDLEEADNLRRSGRIRNLPVHDR